MSARQLTCASTRHWSNNGKVCTCSLRICWPQASLPSHRLLTRPERSRLVVTFHEPPLLSLPRGMLLASYYPPAPGSADFMEAKLKHLELIQGVINRLAGDSARLKNWSVTLVAALFVLLARADRAEYIHVVFVPILAFWALDGYFLCQERLFRALYDHVSLLGLSGIDFSMRVSRFRKGWNRTQVGAMFSATLIGFYGPLAGMVGFAIVL